MDLMPDADMKIELSRWARSWRLGESHGSGECGRAAWMAETALATIADLKAKLAAAEERAERAGVCWFTTGETPDVKPGGVGEYLVTVELSTGRRYVTAGCYLNQFEVDEWDGPGEDDPHTGWHTAGPTPQYDDYYVPLSGVVAWAEKPAAFDPMAAGLAPADEPAGPAKGGRDGE
jgi:hypothetical protein